MKTKDIIQYTVITYNLLLSMNTFVKASYAGFCSSFNVDVLTFAINFDIAEQRKDIQTVYRYT
jgi:hypothetical protein